MLAIKTTYKKRFARAFLVSVKKRKPAPLWRGRAFTSYLRDSFDLQELQRSHDSHLVEVGLVEQPQVHRAGDGDDVDEAVTRHVAADVRGHVGDELVAPRTDVHEPRLVEQLPVLPVQDVHQLVAPRTQRVRLVAVPQAAQIHDVRTGLQLLLDARVRPKSELPHQPGEQVEDRTQGQVPRQAQAWLLEVDLGRQTIDRDDRDVLVAGPLEIRGDVVREHEPGGRCHQHDLLVGTNPSDHEVDDALRLEPLLGAVDRQNMTVLLEQRGDACHQDPRAHLGSGQEDKQDLAGTLLLLDLGYVLEPSAQDRVEEQQGKRRSEYEKQYGHEEPPFR